MSKTIEILDDEIADFIEIYTKRLDKARQDKQDAESRERSALAKLRELGAPVSASIDVMKPATDAFKDAFAPLNKVLLSRFYNQSDTIIGKIKFVLNESNVPMSTNQINNRLYELDPKYNSDRKKTAKNVSSVLSVNHGTGKAFKRSLNENNEYCFTINK
ncbi:MAG: hypothetical protein V4539_20175 [Bacteroidota bacterium]